MHQRPPRIALSPLDTDIEAGGNDLRRYNSRHHEALRPHFAVPTPLASPGGSPLRTKHDRAQHDDSAETLHGIVERKMLTWRERIRHFTWTWFTMTMATGQMANVLYAVPYRFPGLYTIGVIVFLFNICLFVFNIVMITLRFRFYPSTFWDSIKHPSESLFVPAAVISFGTILLNITEYGTESGKAGAWLSDVMVVMFWIYAALAMTFCCGIYLIMWSTQTFTISQMTPVWIFPSYPLLVIGPHAGVLAGRLSGSRALDIIVGGFTLQGVGFMVSLMVYAAFLYRLMTNKLPQESLRPGMFVSVGPSGFTISGIINMGQAIVNCIPDDFMGVGALAGTITVVVANWVGIWLWGLAIFFLLVSIGAHYNCVGHGRLHFAMTWYSFIFPQTGLTTATFAVGKALNNTGFRVLGCVFTGILVIVWFFVFAMMIRAVHTKQILWPQKQEDRDEGGDWTLQIGRPQEKSRHLPAAVRRGDEEELEPAPGALNEE